MISMPVIALAEDEGPECLSRDERAACGRLPEHRRADWRAGRLAVRRATAAVLGLPRPDEIRTSPSVGPLPRLWRRAEDGAPVPLALAVSISHRDGRAAAAVAPGGARVGIDLERSDGVAAGHQRFFLSPAERRAAPPADPCTLWALKEAAWKALRCDARTPFSALELRFDGAGELEAVSLCGAARPARATLSTPWPGYVLAVLAVQEATA